MKPLRYLYSASLAALLILSTTAIAQAQHPNVSDNTGSNVSDNTGNNTSDNTGNNVSDNTGTDTASDRARRAASAGLDEDGVQKLADDLGSAYSACTSGGDCTTFYSLFNLAEDILQSE